MNREIKFNAWLPQLGFMVEGVSVGFGSCGFPADENGEFEKLLKEKGLYDELDNLPYYIYSGDDWWIVTGDKDFVLLQYTGLHDKNNIEIYEGSIIPCKVGTHQYANWKVGDPNAVLNGWVAWNPCQLRWEIQFDKNEYNIVSSCFGFYSGPELNVIGNIFQNPELINPGFDPLNISDRWK